MASFPQACFVYSETSLSPDAKNGAVILSTVMLMPEEKLQRLEPTAAATKGHYRHQY